MSQCLYVYVLPSQRDGQFYVGFTGDLKRRLGEHKDGRVHAFNTLTGAAGLGLLRSLPGQARCDAAREVPQDRVGQALSERPSQKYLTG